MKEERFSHPRKSPHRQGDQPGGGASEPLRRVQQPVCGRQNRVTYCHPVLPSLRCSSTGMGGGCVLKLGLQRSDPGRGTALPVGRQPEEAGLWQLRVYLEEPGRARGARHHYWGVHEDRGGTAIGATFPVCMLSGNRTPTI